jgi:hypothetical protein
MRKTSRNPAVRQVEFCCLSHIIRACATLQGRQTCIYHPSKYVLLLGTEATGRTGHYVTFEACTCCVALQELDAARQAAASAADAAEKKLAELQKKLGTAQDYIQRQLAERQDIEKKFHAMKDDLITRLQNACSQRDEARGQVCFKACYNVLLACPRASFVCCMFDTLVAGRVLLMACVLCLYSQVLELQNELEKQKEALATKEAALAAALAAVPPTPVAAAGTTLPNGLAPAGAMVAAGGEPRSLLPTLSGVQRAMPGYAAGVKSAFDNFATSMGLGVGTNMAAAAAGE